MQFYDQWKSCILTIHNSYQDKITNSDCLHTPTPSKDAVESLFYLQQVMVCSKTFPFSIEMEHLNSYLLLYVKKGTLRITYNHATFLAKENSFLFINCYDYHRLELVDNSCQYDAIYLNGQNINYYYGIFAKNTCPIYTCAVQSELNHLLRKLNLFLSEDTEMNEILRSCTITEILTNIILAKTKEMNTSALIPNHLRQMKSILENRYQEAHTLDSLAIELNFNKYKLAKDFKKFYSISPIDYLISRRIEVAKNTLSQTNLSINDISESVGFRNVPHFINIFKKQEGLTPHQYRTNHILIS
ncbi:MAG TPA: AraC family transcriptional regulator [Lachnospiraceae bacterium]|nr:AraC family transcriptional regulator [Lachnospiraceae bacterium]